MDISYEDDWTVLHLSGEIDVSNVDSLRRDLEALDASAQRWVRFDITGVTFLDSVALGLLARAHQQAKALGGRIQVVGASATMRRLLELSGMAFLLRPDKPSGSVA